ncbi:tyrosine-type recombinase/integrase [Bradyrhizobium oligotrophicum S58]
MGYPDIAGDTIQVVQEKTDQAEADEKLVIPMHPALQRELALHKRRHVAILATAQGKAFSVKGFGQFVSKAIDKAGLPEVCKAHGLRKAAGRRLAEAGCTAKQIQAILGHKTLAESERYTKKADQVRMARQAMNRLQEADGEVAKSTKTISASMRD